MLFLLSLVSSAEYIDQINNLIKEGYNRKAYDTATMYINQQGMLDADPQLFFIRGQCAYQISKFEEAIKDLSRFLTSGSITSQDQMISYRVRGQSRMRLGFLEDALSDAKLSKENFLISQITDLQKSEEKAIHLEKEEKWEQAIEIYNLILKTAISGVKYLVNAANCALKLGDSDRFLELSHQAMQISPKNAKLLELRGKFFLCDGDFVMAANHFKLCRNVASDSTTCTLLTKAATGFKDNHAKAVNATNLLDYDAAQPYIDQCEQISRRRCEEDSKLSVMVKTLKVKVMIGKGKKREALHYIDEILKQFPNSTELYLERADIYLEDQDLDQAMADYQAARKISPHDKRANEGVEKVGKMQDDEKNIDYYEALGLKKGASMSEIKAAYRKGIRDWHPDRHRGKDEKRKAEKKMKNINRAYDVLSDPEKKKMYDMGQDPENPMGGGGGPGPGENPFQFFRQGGGFNFGGQNIRFEFNF